MEANRDLLHQSESINRNALVNFFTNPKYLGTDVWKRGIEYAKINKFFNKENLEEVILRFPDEGSLELASTVIAINRALTPFVDAYQSMMKDDVVKKYDRLVRTPASLHTQTSQPVTSGIAFQHFPLAAARFHAEMLYWEKREPLKAARVLEQALPKRIPSEPSEASDWMEAKFMQISLLRKGGQWLQADRYAEELLSQKDIQKKRPHESAAALAEWGMSAEKNQDWRKAEQAYGDALHILGEHPDVRQHTMDSFKSAHLYYHHAVMAHVVKNHSGASDSYKHFFNEIARHPEVLSELWPTEREKENALYENVLKYQGGLRRLEYPHKERSLCLNAAVASLSHVYATKGDESPAQQFLLDYALGHRELNKELVNEASAFVEMPGAEKCSPYQCLDALLLMKDYSRENDLPDNVKDACGRIMKSREWKVVAVHACS